MAKLTTLFLQNYRNIPEIKLDFEGRDGKIVGMNRVGKTNCLEAICYLLTDKLLGGSADIPSIKPQSNTRLKVVVEGTFITDDGAVTLRKEFYELWSRPRGSATEELKGHVTDYYINGAKQVRAKDFFEALSEKFGIPTELSGLDAYQLTIDPFYLGQFICGGKDWKLGRKAIIEIVGDVEPSEIYEFNENTRIAKGDLERHQFNDTEAKKAIKGEIDGFKKKMLEHESLINEYERTISQNCSDEEYDSAIKEQEKVDEQIAKLKLDAANPYADEVTELQKELYGLNLKYNETANASIDRTKSESLRKQINAKREALSRELISQKTDDFNLNMLRNSLKDRRDTQEGYKKQIEDIKLQFNSIVVNDTCPTCGQKLPAEQVEEAINTKKAELKSKAEGIRAKAIENKAEIDKLTKQIEDFDLKDYHKTIPSLQNEVSDLEKDLMAAVSEEESQVKRPDPKVVSRIQEINARLAEINKLQSQTNENKAPEIQRLKDRKYELQVILSKRISAKQAESRVSELKAQNVTIGNQQADAEQRFWAVGEFVKAKLTLLNKHMSEKLGSVRFQLIKENIKAGSYDEVCVPYIIDPLTGKTTETLFPDGSKSEQIYTGIQIIKAIRDVKGWTPLPIVFDQGGELDDRSTENVAYNAEAQVIEVKVEGNSRTPTFVPFDNN